MSEQQEVTKELEPINPALYRKAIEVGKEIYGASNSKAEAAREIFKMLIDEPREIVLKAFIEGASITVKGSPTYYYNIRRKLRKQQRSNS